MKMRVRLTRRTLVSRDGKTQKERAKKQPLSEDDRLERLGRGVVCAAGRLEVGRRELKPATGQSQRVRPHRLAPASLSHWPSQPCSPWVSEAGSWSLVPGAACILVWSFHG